MDFLLEITKIIDGGLRSDPQKIVNYAEQLARKVEESGDKAAAKRLRDCLTRRGGAEVALNDFSPAARLPVDSESRLHLADEIEPPTEPPFVALSPTIQRQVDEFLRYVASADKLIAKGVGISPSLLMYGPPGCGKTVLAKHIAARLGMPLLIARSDSLISSYLGSTAKNMRALFEHAMGRPSVLFLDEFDAFAKQRDDKHELGELKRVVVSLLQNIDALDGRTVLLAASNHEHLLDPAVWRRFSCKLRFELPTEVERAAMFRSFLSAYSPTDSIHLFASASETMSGAQIRHVCEDSIREAILIGENTISEYDLFGRIARTRLAAIADPGENPEAEAEAKRFHDLDPHVFTCTRLAEIFKKSRGTVSRWLKEA